MKFRIKEIIDGTYHKFVPQILASSIPEDKVLNQPCIVDTEELSENYHSNKDFHENVEMWNNIGNPCSTQQECVSVICKCELMPKKRCIIYYDVETIHGEINDEIKIHSRTLNNIQ